MINENIFFIIILKKKLSIISSKLRMWLALLLASDGLHFMGLILYFIHFKKIKTTRYEDKRKFYLLLIENGWIKKNKMK